MSLSELGARRAVIGAALMRASLGCVLLYEYAVNYSQRHYLWGPERITSGMSETAIHAVLYGLSSSPWYFELVFHGAIFVTCLFTVGFGGRATTVALYILTLALQDLNHMITDGGDNIARIMLFYMMFADVSGRRTRDVSVTVGLIHNLAILAVVFQLSLMYLSTGMYKVMGESWQSGVALYYIMRVHYFTWAGVSEHLYSNGFLVVALTYGTVLFEIAFPFLLLNRWTRWLAVCVGLLFHGGIALLMGLFAFSWMMVSFYFVLISDAEYERVKNTFALPVSGVVLYDGTCGFCGRFVRFVRSRDRRRALSFAHLQSAMAKGVLAGKDVDGSRLDTLYVIGPDGGVLGKAGAVIFVMRCLGWPWCWVALLSVLPVCILDAAYGLVARNRRLFGGRCEVEPRKQRQEGR